MTWTGIFIPYIYIYYRKFVFYLKIIFFIKKKEANTTLMPVASSSIANIKYPVKIKKFTAIKRRVC